MTASPRHGHLVVVGAGTGLGASLARRFAREGFGVSLVSREAATLVEVQDTITSYHVPVDTHAVDVVQAHELERALAEAVDRHGMPDVVVYNAAVIRTDAPGDLSVDELAQTFSINTWGALRVALATIPGMQIRGSGTFLVTGGMPQPVPSRFSLSLGKASLRAATSMLAEYYGPSGVHVATVTVTDEIRPGTAFDPDLIAEDYWRLHRQRPEDWRAEHVFGGVPRDDFGR